MSTLTQMTALMQRRSGKPSDAALWGTTERAPPGRCIRDLPEDLHATAWPEPRTLLVLH